ncbi:MAG: hypothetical protein ACJ8DY_12575, partial [Xanthobacteraceae bacterium]
MTASSLKTGITTLYSISLSRRIVSDPAQNVQYDGTIKEMLCTEAASTKGITGKRSSFGGTALRAAEIVNKSLHVNGARDRN